VIVKTTDIDPKDPKLVQFIRKMVKLFQIASEEGATDKILDELDRVIERAGEKIETIILTAGDFCHRSRTGMSEAWPMTQEILDPARLAEWSGANAERLNGCTIELIPLDEVKRIHTQYKGQPRGDQIYLATTEIFEDKQQQMYALRWSPAEWTLVKEHNGPFLHYAPYIRFMFRLRRPPSLEP